MLYLVAIFCSPLALLLIGKIFQAIFNLVIWLAAIILSLTIIFWWPGGVVVWAAGVVHAVLAINNHRADKRSRALIETMRSK